MPPRGFFSRRNRLHRFAWDQLDAVSLSILRQCFPPEHPLRRSAEQTLERRGLGLPRGREDLLHRLTSLDGVDERWLLAQWHLVEGGTPAAGESRASVPSAQCSRSLPGCSWPTWPYIAISRWTRRRHVVGWSIEYPDAVRRLELYPLQAGAGRNFSHTQRHPGPALQRGLRKSAGKSGGFCAPVSTGSSRHREPCCISRSMPA